MLLGGIFAEHFGFNTNILETNVLNLAVVIAVVIIYIGDALRGLLATRKQNIVTTFQEADQRAQQAQERVNEARAQLQQAESRAQQIREQAQVTIDQEKNQMIRQNQEDIERVRVLQQETLQFEQQKTQNELAQRLVRLALQQVRDQLAQRMNTSIHGAINNFQIVLFTNYTPGV